uniref:ARAD1B16588p n=1 Tax=Blastobotrys adeninivorans TaxID=409370 RepID=A0A060TCH6_BLAAD
MAMGTRIRGPSRGLLRAVRWNHTKPEAPIRPLPYSAYVPRKFPGVVNYFRTNRSAPIIFLAGWTLTLLGGLVKEKNEYEEIERRGLRKIEALEQLLDKIKSGEINAAEVDIDRELDLADGSGRSIDEVLEELERDDQEWAQMLSEKEQQLNNILASEPSEPTEPQHSQAAQPQPSQEKPKKSRKDYDSAKFL